MRVRRRGARVERARRGPVASLTAEGPVAADPVDSPLLTRPRTVWALPAMRALALLSFVGFSSFFLTLAALPVRAVSAGVPASAAGLVITTMLAATVVCQMLVPRAIARFGVRSVLVAGLLLLAVPAPLYLVSPNLGVLCLVSAIRGAGFGALTVLGSVVSALVAPKSQQGAAVGAYGLAIAGANLIALPGGAALAVAGHFLWVALIATLPVLVLPLVPRMLSGTRAPDPTSVEKPRTGKAVLRLLPPSFILFVTTLVGGGLAASLPLERPDGALVALALFAFGVAAAAGRWRTGAWADEVGARGLLAGAIGTAAVGVAVLGVALALPESSGAVAAAVAGAAVLGGGYGAVQNLTMLVAFERADDVNLASSVWNAAFDSGMATGAAVVAAVAVGGLGLPLTYIACALLILISLPLVGRAPRAGGMRPQPCVAHAPCSGSHAGPRGPGPRAATNSRPATPDVA